MVNVEKTPNATYIDTDELSLVEYRKEGGILGPRLFGLLRSSKEQQLAGKKLLNILLMR